MCPRVHLEEECTDPECRYAHDKSELRGTPEFWKTKICLGWVARTCSLGKNCRYAHGKTELRMPPNVEPTAAVKTNTTSPNSKIDDNKSDNSVTAPKKEVQKALASTDVSTLGIEDAIIQQNDSLVMTQLTESDFCSVSDVSFPSMNANNMKTADNTRPTRASALAVQMKAAKQPQNGVINGNSSQQHVNLNNATSSASSTKVSPVRRSPAPTKLSGFTSTGGEIGNKSSSNNLTSMPHFQKNSEVLSSCSSSSSPLPSIGNSFLTSSTAANKNNNYSAKANRSILESVPTSNVKPSSSSVSTAASNRVLDVNMMASNNSHLQHHQHQQHDSNNNIMYNSNSNIQPFFINTSCDNNSGYFVIPENSNSQASVPNGMSVTTNQPSVFLTANSNIGNNNPTYPNYDQNKNPKIPSSDATFNNFNHGFGYGNTDTLQIPSYPSLTGGVYDAGNNSNNIHQHQNMTQQQYGHNNNTNNDNMFYDSSYANGNVHMMRNDVAWHADMRNKHDSVVIAQQSEHFHNQVSHPNDYIMINNHHTTNHHHMDHMNEFNNLNSLDNRNIHLQQQHSIHVIPSNNDLVQEGNYRFVQTNMYQHQQFHSPNQQLSVNQNNLQMHPQYSTKNNIPTSNLVMSSTELSHASTFKTPNNHMNYQNVHHSNSMSVHPPHNTLSSNRFINHGYFINNNNNNSNNNNSMHFNNSNQHLYHPSQQQQQHLQQEMVGGGVSFR